MVSTSDPLMTLLLKSKIAVVYGNTKSNASAVIRPFANVRSWKSYEHVARSIAASLATLGFQAIIMPDGSDLIPRLRENNIDLVSCHLCPARHIREGRV